MSVLPTDDANLDAVQREGVVDGWRGEQPVSQVRHGLPGSKLDSLRGRELSSFGVLTANRAVQNGQLHLFLLHGQSSSKSCSTRFSSVFSAAAVLKCSSQFFCLAILLPPVSARYLNTAACPASLMSA